MGLARAAWGSGFLQVALVHGVAGLAFTLLSPGLLSAREALAACQGGRLSYKSCQRNLGLGKLKNSRFSQVMIVYQK